MQEDEEAIPGWNEDEPLRAEPRGFSPEQMLTCETCLRANPPTRASCLYCGAALPLTGEAASLIKPVLRPLEKWEQGFNTIHLPSGQQLPASSLAEISGLLKLEAADVQRITASAAPLPLARAATLEEARVIEQRLGALGLKVLVVADGELDAHAPQRIRSMELSDEALEVYQPGGRGEQRIAWEDIGLIVAGRRLTRRLEVAERLSRKKEKQIVDSRELSSDEPRLDLYLRREEGGWRVAADNFDFSCLREQKSLLAAQNFQTLTGVLRERAKNAVYDDSYLQARPLLSLVWPLEQHTESLGLRKQSGRVNTGAATTSDNEKQFTRYSKLLHHLKLHGDGRKA